MSSPVYPETGTKHGVSAELASAIREDERRQGRLHTPGERRAFVAGFAEVSAALSTWRVK